MPEVQLSAGTIHYEDSGARARRWSSPTGCSMDATMWDPVLAQLPTDLRVVRPVLPLGAHARPMREHADLSMGGRTAAPREFLERLDLDGVTLVVSDWGGPIVFLADGPPAQVARVARLVLLPGEAFEDVVGMRLARCAGRMGSASRHRRAGCPRRLRELPTHFGWMTRRGVPEAMLAGGSRRAGPGGRAPRPGALHAQRSRCATAASGCNRSPLPVRGAGADPVGERRQGDASGARAADRGTAARLPTGPRRRC